LCPIIAEIVLQDLEMKALTLLNIEIPFYHRYVDDIAMAAPRQKINECLNAFNSLHNRLQFRNRREKIKFSGCDNHKQ